MSVRLMSEVWEIASELSSQSELLVLLALADHADDAGYCWPSLERLAQRAKVTERHARRLITKLIDAGHLQADRTGGRGRASSYVITPKKEDMAMSPFTPKKEDMAMSPFAAQKEDIGSIKGDIGGIKEDIAMSPQSPIEPSDQGVGEKSLLNGGGEGPESHALTTDAAAASQEKSTRADCAGWQPDAAAAGLPDAVLAAWRWPLTPEASKGLANAVRGYSEGEVLAAIEDMIDRKGPPIEKPMGYLLTVLKRRASALVDRATAAAAAGSPDFAEVATQTAAHRQPVPRPEPHPAPAAAGGDDEHAAEVQAAFERALKNFHPVTQQALAGARCTNGNGFDVHLAPQMAGRVAFLEQRKHEIAGGMAAELRRPMREAVRFVVAAG